MDLIERGEEEVGWRPGAAAGVHFLGRGVIEVGSDPTYIVVETLSRSSNGDVEDVSLGFRIDRRHRGEPPPRFEAPQPAVAIEPTPLRPGEVRYLGREQFFYPLRSDLPIEDNLAALADFVERQRDNDEAYVDVRAMQRENFKYLLERFNPSDETEFIVFSIVGTYFLRIHASPWLSDAALRDDPRFHLWITLRPVIDPWINLYELLALAWRHGWVAQEDIRSLTELATILDEGYARELLEEFRRLNSGRIPLTPSSAPESSRFAVFAEKHWSFRRGISRALFGLLHQHDVVSTLCPGGPFSQASLAGKWLDSTSQTNPKAVALKALLELHANLEHIASEFANTSVGPYLAHFYQPWRESLDPMVAHIAEALGTTRRR